MELPQPISMFAPVFHSNVDGAFVDNQLASLMRHLDSAPLAATIVTKDGAQIVGVNSTIRNAYAAPASSIVGEAGAFFDALARRAWATFSFHARVPTPDQWQPLIYKPGGFFVTHWDDSRGHMLNSKNYMYRDNPNRSMTVLLYLNDDYEGGAITFPNILDASGNPYKIKPRKGDVIAFPSHEVFAHRVEAVTTGTRYVLSRWFDDTEWFKSYGALNVQLRAGVLQELQSVQYGHQSIASTDSVRFFNKTFVSDTELNNLNTDKTEELEAPGIKAVWNALRNSRICHQHALLRCYSNLQTFGLDSEPHTDSDSRNSYTTIIYAVDNWERRWGGETCLYSKDSPSRAIEVTPWNIVQFRGDMVHVAKSPTRYYNGVRRTLMFKTRRVYEIQPESRPVTFL